MTLAEQIVGAIVAEKLTGGDPLYVVVDGFSHESFNLEPWNQSTYGVYRCHGVPVYAGAADLPKCLRFEMVKSTVKPSRWAFTVDLQ